MDDRWQRFGVQLRWGDLDAQGHVNNALVADYCQEARASFLRTSPVAHLLGGGVVVVRHRLEYLRPIQFSTSPLEVGVGVVEVGGARFGMGYELVQDGEVCARAVTLQCPFDFTTQRPRRLTPEERDFLSSLLSPAPEMRVLHVPHLAGRGHRHDIFVRWSDLDPYNHVNNARYFDIVQEARVAMTTAADPGTARDAHDLLWLIARQDVDYLAQVDCRAEPFAVFTAPVAIGTSSVTLAAEVVDPLDDSVRARARTVLVCAGLEGRPQPLPAATRAAFEPLLVG